MGRIIDQLDFTKFKKNPKWVIGFSDITVLHAHLFTKIKMASLHAPMAAAFNEGPLKEPGGQGSANENEFIQSLHHAIIGKKARYICAAHPFNRTGTAMAELVGGNLSLLAHLTGTPSAINTKNKILFIEDIGEYIYNIDRMMYQLKRSGQLDNLAGLIVGGFTDMKDTERPFGKTAYEVIKEIIAPYNFPVCFNFPVSHGKENYALKVGIVYNLKVSKTKTQLSE